ncbi:MAG: DUF3187 family protein [Nevskiales bacterium]
MQQALRILPALAGLSFFAGLARAETPQPSLQPYATFNQFQFLQLYGFPVLRHYQVLPDGARSSDFAFDLTNHLEIGSNAEENFIVDGEQLHATLIFRQGFGDNLEWALEVPLMRQSGGFLDSHIDDFHDTFGFARGRRARTNDDEIRYLYQRNGVTLVDIDSSQQGIGDIRVVLTRQLKNMPEGRGASVSGLLKLPTGDADKLTGSGGTDVAVWATYGAEPVNGSRWSWLGTVGALYTSDGDFLEDQRKNGGVFGSYTLGWRWSDTIQLKGQIYGHSALYKDTELKPLRDFAVLGIVGLGWRVTPVIDLDFGIAEDLHQGASADVSLHFAVRRRI